MTKKGTTLNTGRTHFKKGMNPWNKGLKGYHAGEKHYRFGKHLSDEVKQKISLNRKGKTAKENYPMWKGGIVSQDKLERNRFRNEMQTLVFKRDDYTCQMCGEKGKYLQVDHIQKWSDYVELRFEMSNLRTLCMDCHYLITFGKPKPKDVIWGQNQGRRIKL